jgi:hypothetical protein
VMQSSGEAPSRIGSTRRKNLSSPIVRKIFTGARPKAWGQTGPTASAASNRSQARTWYFRAVQR